MLQKSFLRIISDWSMEEISRADELEAAFNELGVLELLQIITDQEMFMTLTGLTSEWVLYEYHTKCFDGKTTLEYFVANNPLKLSETKIRAYTNLLGATIQMYEVMKVIKGQSVTVRASNGNVFDIFDINTSLSIVPHTTIVARVAKVAGVYNIVGHMAYAVPGIFTKQATEYLTPTMSTIIGWLIAPEKLTFDTLTAPEPEDLALRESDKMAAKFNAALRKYGMQDMFDHTAVYEWETDRRRFSVHFGSRSLFALIPEQYSLKNSSSAVFNELMSAYTQYANTLPRTKSEKIPRSQLYKKTERTDTKKFSTDIFSLNPYIKISDAGHNQLIQGKFNEAYHSFTKVVASLLKDKVLTVLSYRTIANAGVALLNDGEQSQDYKKIWLGKKLVEASIRMNPEYEFGKSMLVEITKRHSIQGPGETKKEFITWLKAIERYADSAYSKSIFAKYEAFLKKSYVSLKYKGPNKTTTIVLEPTSPRNAPCPCQSGKKYKKCCGNK
jgi:hypothetical protein